SAARYSFSRCLFSRYSSGPSLYQPTLAPPPPELPPPKPPQLLPPPEKPPPDDQPPPDDHEPPEGDPESHHGLLPQADLRARSRPPPPLPNCQPNHPDPNAMGNCARGALGKAERQPMQTEIESISPPKSINDPFWAPMPRPSRKAPIATNTISDPSML